MNNTISWSNSFLLDLSIDSVKSHTNFQQTNSNHVSDLLQNVLRKHKNNLVVPALSKRRYRGRAVRLTTETIYDVFKDKQKYHLFETVLLNEKNSKPFVRATSVPYKYEWCNYGNGRNIKIAALVKILNNNRVFVKQYPDEDLRILIMNTFQIESYSRETLAGKTYRKYLADQIGSSCRETLADKTYRKYLVDFEFLVL